MKFATVFGAVALCVAPVFGGALIPNNNGTTLHHHNSTSIRNSTATHNYTIIPTGAPSAVPVHHLFTRNLQDEAHSSPKLGKFGFKRTPVRQIKHFEA